MSAEQLSALELEHRLAKAESDLNTERTARLEAERKLSEAKKFIKDFETTIDYKLKEKDREYDNLLSKIKVLEEKLKLIEHDNAKECPMCKAETKIDPQPIELSGVKLTANIRQCTKCDFSWLPSREENRLDVAVIKVLEARFEKCLEQRNELINNLPSINDDMSINNSNLLFRYDQELEQIKDLEEQENDQAD